MITSLDHFVLLCPDITSGVDTYRRVLGIDPVWRAKADGAAVAVFKLGNTALELMAPDGTGPVATKLREMQATGTRLTTLVYRSDDLAGDHHLFGRRGLSPSEITRSTSTHSRTGQSRAWSRFRVPDQAMAGIKTFVLQPETELGTPSAAGGSVTGLDHLVINTSNPDRAVANYAGRLGIRLALDRTAEQWKTRFLFFTLGGLTLEVVHRLDGDHDPTAPDRLWGLTWACDDLVATHDRLSRGGLDVSEIRVGRKPGSQVFTLRNGTLDVPTLFIQHDAG